MQHALIVDKRGYRLQRSTGDAMHCYSQVFGYVIILVHMHCYYSMLHAMLCSFGRLKKQEYYFDFISDTDSLSNTNKFA